MHRINSILYSLVLNASQYRILILNRLIGMRLGNLFSLVSLLSFVNAKLCGSASIVTRHRAASLVLASGLWARSYLCVRLCKWKKQATDEYVMIITTGISTQSTHSLHISTSTQKKQHIQNIVFRRQCNWVIY